MTTKDYKGISTKMAKDSLEMSDEDLLRDLYHQYDVAFSKNDPAQINRTIAYFSTLLIKLSRQAEESTKENIKMQRTITDLTRKLYLLTIALFFIALLQVILPFFQHPPEIKYLIQKEENNKTLQKETNPVSKTHADPVSNK